MDNLSSHKVAGVREAIEAAGAELRYLPPYSPDLNVAGSQRRGQVLLHPSEKQLAIDSPVYRQRCDESFSPHRTEERRGLPATAGRFLNQSRPDRRATIGPRHVRFRPCFIDENGLLGRNVLLLIAPLLTRGRHVGTILLARNQRLFFRVSSSALHALQNVIKQTTSFRSVLRSACSSRK